MKNLFVIISLLIATLVNANPLHDETTTFKVYGNCEMCKKRIETSLKKPGITSANWNVDTKIVTLVYNSHSIALEDIHKAIAAAGYDTEKEKASDKAYSKLPECCQYERVK
ncbi:MAG: heavy-metal-associated domain-containing protein [Cytophagales bacterium]